MKRTLLITLEYPPLIGGVSRYYQHLMELLPHDQRWVLDNEQHELLSTSQWIWPRWLKGVVSTWRTVTQYRIEHILVGNVLPLGTIALLIKLLRRVPYTVMTHAMDITVPLHPNSPRRKQMLLQTVLRHAESITTVSRYTKERLLSLGIPESRIHVIHPCPHINGSVEMHVPTVPSMNNVLPEKKVLLSVGRLIERKGFDMVIRSLRRIREVIPNVHYVIVGEGNYGTTVQSIAEQVGVQEYVTFVGQCTDQELAAWYNRCDVFIMPSRELCNNDTEGFGIVYLEASSFGKPVIGSTAGGVTDAVVDGQTGFVVDPEDIEMIADACTRLLSNTTLAQQLGTNGQQRVKDIFRWDVQVEQLKQLLTTV